MFDNKERCAASSFVWTHTVVETRETGEGWPLLTVETWGSKGTNKRAPSWLDCWAFRAMVQEMFFLPWLLLSAKYKIVFFSRYHISINLSPFDQQARQAVVLGRLSLNMCRWLKGGSIMVSYFQIQYCTYHCLFLFLLSAYCFLWGPPPSSPLSNESMIYATSTLQTVKIRVC